MTGLSRRESLLLDQPRGEELRQTAASEQDDTGAPGDDQGVAVDVNAPDDGQGVAVEVNAAASDASSDLNAVQPKVSIGSSAAADGGRAAEPRAERHPAWAQTTAGYRIPLETTYCTVGGVVVVLSLFRICLFVSAYGFSFGLPFSLFSLVSL